MDKHEIFFIEGVVHPKFRFILALQWILIQYETKCLMFKPRQTTEGFSIIIVISACIEF